MNRRVDLISEQEVAHQGIFRLIEAHLRHERYDGHMSDEIVRISFERGDSVAAVLHDPAADTVLLVEQFRYPTLKNGSGWMLELPAGIYVPAEGGGQEMSMRREVLEETGFEVHDLRIVNTFYLSPGASSERIFLYYGTLRSSDQVAPGGGIPGEGEDIMLISIPLDEALARIETGEIEDAKTIIGLLWLKLQCLRMLPGETILKSPGA